MESKEKKSDYFRLPRKRFFLFGHSKKVLHENGKEKTYHGQTVSA